MIVNVYASSTGPWGAPIEHHFWVYLSEYLPTRLAYELVDSVKCNISPSPKCARTNQSTEGPNRRKGGETRIFPPCLFFSASLLDLRQLISSHPAMRLGFVPSVPTGSQASELRLNYTTSLPGSPDGRRHIVGYLISITVWARSSSPQHKTQNLPSPCASIRGHLIWLIKGRDWPLNARRQEEVMGDSTWHSSMANRPGLAGEIWALSVDTTQGVMPTSGRLSGFSMLLTFLGETAITAGQALVTCLWTAAHVGSWSGGWGQPQAGGCARLDWGC